MRGARGSLLVRFFKKIRVPSADPDACWEWTGARTRGGYGHIGAGRRTLKAHRVAWEIANGPIPDGMVVRHKCNNPPCVRPLHLELGTHADNNRDMAARCRGRCSAVGLPYGVSPHGRRWKVQIWTGGHGQHLGTFGTIEEAADAAQQAREDLYDH